MLHRLPALGPWSIQTKKELVDQWMFIDKMFTNDENMGFWNLESLCSRGVLITEGKICPYQGLNQKISEPGVSKGCCLQVFKYLKASKKHSFETP